jgi:hypothetical protein
MPPAAPPVDFGMAASVDTTEEDLGRPVTTWVTLLGPLGAPFVGMPPPSFAAAGRVARERTRTRRGRRGAAVVVVVERESFIVVVEDIVVGDRFNLISRLLVVWMRSGKGLMRIVCIVATKGLSSTGI